MGRELGHADDGPGFVTTTVAQVQAWLNGARSAALTNQHAWMILILHILHEVTTLEDSVSLKGGEPADVAMDCNVEPQVFDAFVAAVAAAGVRVVTVEQAMNETGYPG